MKIMRLVYIILPVLFFVACTEELEDEQNDWKKPAEPGKITEVETTYEEGEFDNPIHAKLLKELQLCGPKDDQCPRCATCSPKFFRFFKISQDTNV